MLLDVLGGDILPEEVLERHLDDDPVVIILAEEHLCGFRIFRLVELGREHDGKQSSLDQILRRWLHRKESRSFALI